MLNFNCSLASAENAENPTKQSQYWWDISSGSHGEDKVIATSRTLTSWVVMALLYDKVLDH